MFNQNSIITYSPDISESVWDKLAGKQFCYNTLPKEIWKIILFYLTESNLTYSSLLAFFSINNSLSSLRREIHCLNPFLFREYSLIKLLHTNLTIPKQMKSICSLRYYSLLAIDQKGRHFYGASLSIGIPCQWLYISDPNKGCMSIDLCDDDASINEIGNDSVDGLIPTEKGFVVFSKEGFGIWEFQDSTPKPTIQKFVSLELEEENITFLGHYEGKCFFRIGYTKNYLVKRDVRIFHFVKNRHI